MTKKELLVWSKNTRGKLGVAIQIKMNCSPTLILPSFNENKRVKLPEFFYDFNFFIKEYRLAYSTEQLIEYIEEVIETYVANVYPNIHPNLSDEIEDRLAVGIIEYLAPYIQHVREHGLQEPVESETHKSGETLSLATVDKILKEEYMAKLQGQLNQATILDKLYDVVGGVSDVSKGPQPKSLHGINIITDPSVHSNHLHFTIKQSSTGNKEVTE